MRSSRCATEHRLLWTGNTDLQPGDWMDQIALNWLVYQLTGSAFYLGILNLARLAPILVFTLIGGVIADRVERRWLMFITQTVAMVLAFVLAVLVSNGSRPVLDGGGDRRGARRGAGVQLPGPAIADLRPGAAESVTNAVALNQATTNLTRVIGPTIGGIPDRDDRRGRGVLHQRC